MNRCASTISPSGLCGVVGSGKTVTLRRLQELLANDNRVAVSKSIAVEKSRATLGTLITALFCDLSTDKDPRIPKQGEVRERALRNLVRKRKKPIVLIVDEAHDLHHHTLTGLKRLIEMVADGGGKLCVLLAGHPKLRNDLKSDHGGNRLPHRGVLTGRHHRQSARVSQMAARHLHRRGCEGR
jgi:type II secretory pathway predicted ATPase ExeA